MLLSPNRLALVALALGALAAADPSAGGTAVCVGDCNQDRQVALGEIQTALDIFFEDRALGECPPADANGGGDVSLGEVQIALDNFFNDCPGAPTRTPAPTNTAVDTPTVAADTPTPTRTPTRTFTPTLTPTSTSTPIRDTPTPDPVLFSGTIEELVPHGLGDFLTYQVTRTSGGNTTERREVTRVGSEGQSSTFSVHTVEGGNEMIEDFADLGNDLIQRRLEEEVGQRDVCTTCIPELLQLRTPLIAGQTSISNSICTVRECPPRNTFLGTFPQQNEITPMERVDNVVVPAGTYDGVIRIKAIAKILDGEEINDVFIVPGIGIIRRDFEFKTTQIRRELVDGMIGGQPVRR